MLGSDEKNVIRSLDEEKPILLKGLAGCHRIRLFFLNLMTSPTYLLSCEYCSLGFSKKSDGQR